ncbi:GM24108 [Drosophila sechellia]|uniref:GM24108 n=1 Tax=Drosophila sechellia TaxID=7238 RepID=B4HFS8_DROSE|nr:GM24108 [Drosophila sechellia]
MSTPEQRFWLAALLFLLSPHSGVRGFGINLMKVQTEDKGQEACILALLRKYFDSGDGLSGSVLCINRNYQLPNIEEQLLRGMNNYVNYPWSLLITNSREGPSPAKFLMNKKPQCYFLIVDNLEDEDLDEVFEHWKGMVNWNPLAQFVVYLASLEETDEEMTDLMVELLLTFINKKIFNVNVIGQSEENQFYYGKTVFPYHPDNNCGNRVISVELLDACDYPSEEPESEDENDGEEGDGAQEEGDGPQEEGNGDQEEEDGPQEQEDGDQAEGDEGQENDDGGPENKTENEFPIGSSGVEENSESITSQGANESNITEIETVTVENVDYDENPEGTRFYHSIKTQQNLVRQFVTPNNDYSDNSLENTSVFLATNYDNGRDSNNEDNAEEFPESAKDDDELENDLSSNSSEPEAIIEEFFRAKFEDKFPRDLSGCPLTASFRPWEPYIFRNSEEQPVDDYYYGLQGDGDDYNDTSPNYGELEDESYADPGEDGDGGIPDTETQSGGKLKLSGIEYEMVQTIAERLHVSIEMQVENSNLYHLFQQLIDGEIEMIVGGIDEDPSISQFVSSSIPYHQDELTWCVARAKRRHGFFNFVATFNADAGFLIGIFVVTCSLVVCLAQRVSGFQLRNLNGYFPTCLRVLGILLNQAIPAQDFPITLRQLFALSFLMGFFFSNTYQSFLISTLTTPRSSYQIHTLQEIYSNKMTVMGTSEHVRHLNKDGEIFKYIREKFQMCYNLVDCLNDAAQNEHIAVAVSRQHSFYNPRIQRDRLYCFDRRESLYVYLVTMLLPKKYHLLHQINPVVQHIIESGHMQKWARDLDMRRMIHEEITRVREDPFKALTFDQFRGAILFSGGLLLVASCVFAFEFCYVKYVHRSEKRERKTKNPEKKCIILKFNMIRD